MKKILSMILAALMIVSVMSVAVAAETETVILYTNDVHCAIDDYPVLAACRAELIAQGKNVITVDAGDAIQGEVIGSLTKGEAVVDIMNTVGYDYAVPGNHEFDYGVDNLKDLAGNKAEYTYLSSNFYDLATVDPVFVPYAIKDFGECQVAFVGISTPDTITSSTPEYFKDENGNFIYGFPKFPAGMTNEALYENVQESVDNAIAEGADIVVAVGHLGILGSIDGWKSSDVIANTDGIDFFVDGHSHETTVSAAHKNKNNEDVFLTSTGEKLTNFGVLTINGDSASFKLVNPDDIDVETMSADAKAAYNTVKAKVDGYNEDISYLFEEIGTSEAKLVIYDSDRNRIIRNQETNAGDFVADAYRAITGADIAIANGGGIRAEIEVGVVSRKNLMDVNAYNNEMCVLEVTGQQLVDVLEHGARRCPELIGGFFQVSGITFEIHTYRETPVITDQLDNFIGMDETKERRVQNVLVGGEPVELDKTYTLAGSQYVLTQGGDGLTMLDCATIVQSEGLPCDSEMLIKYFTETLGGKITAEQYGNPKGDGRIRIISKDPDADYDYEIGFGETITITVEDNRYPVFVKYVAEETAEGVLFAKPSDIMAFGILYEEDRKNVICTGEIFCGRDSRLVHRFEKGKTYYFEIVSEHYSPVTFDITLDCDHDYENGVCTVCGNACDHSMSLFLGYCPCGMFCGVDMKDGAEVEFAAADYEDSMWIRVKPEKSGAYILESVTTSEEGDPDCVIYESGYDWLEADILSADFRLIYNLEAGKTYHYEVSSYSEETVCTVKFSRAVHTADDGSIHGLEYVEETESDCLNHGYTEGLYCSVCDEYAWGHYEKELSEHHHDGDFNDYCDICGLDIDTLYPDCDHICHSDNIFVKFIWKILKFFDMIFFRDPYCDCGKQHYPILIIE